MLWSLCSIRSISERRKNDDLGWFRKLVRLGRYIAICTAQAWVLEVRPTVVWGILKTKCRVGDSNHLRAAAEGSHLSHSGRLSRRRYLPCWCAEGFQCNDLCKGNEDQGQEYPQQDFWTGNLFFLLFNRYAHARQDATRKGISAIDNAYSLWLVLWYTIFGDIY